MRGMDECRHTARIRVERLQPIVGREDRSPAEKDHRDHIPVRVRAGVSDVTARVRVVEGHSGASMTRLSAPLGKPRSSIRDGRATARRPPPSASTPKPPPPRFLKRRTERAPASFRTSFGGEKTTLTPSVAISGGPHSTSSQPRKSKEATRRGVRSLRVAVITLPASSVFPAHHRTQARRLRATVRKAYSPKTSLQSLIV